MKLFCSLLLPIILSPFLGVAQFTQASLALPEGAYSDVGLTRSPYKRKLLQRNWGAIVGIQRGKGTALELGAEAHWRKLSLSNSKIVGATTNLEYNFSDHVIGYKAGAWMKRGRVNLTYGGNLVYFSDFDGRQRYGVGPSVGFRLAGFHLVNGLNILAGDKEMEGANTLYMSLRYYFPVDNKFTWDKKTRKKKKKKEKERAKKKKEREQQKKDGEKRGIWKILDNDNKKSS